MRMSRILLLTVLPALVTACSQETSTPDSLDLGTARVAVVNGKPVAESVLRTYVLATERRNLEDLSAEDRERVVNDVIGLELLAQEAEKQGLTASRSLAAQLELAAEVGRLALGSAALRLLPRPGPRLRLSRLACRHASHSFRLRSRISVRFSTTRARSFSSRPRICWSPIATCGMYFSM